MVQIISTTTTLSIASFALSCLAFYFSALRRKSLVRVSVSHHDINSHVEQKMHVIGIQCSVFNHGNTPVLLERADLVIDFIGPEGPWHLSLDHPVDKVISPFSIETFWDKFHVPKELFGLILPKKGTIPTRIKFRLKNYKGIVREGSLQAIVFEEVGIKPDSDDNIESVIKYSCKPSETLFNWRFWQRAFEKDPKISK